MIPVIVDSRARALQTPLLHWRLDETTGLLLDSSGNAFDGTNDGATLGVAGHIDLATDFDGVNDDITNINAPLTSQLEGITEFTICFWASDTSLNAYDCALSFGDGSGDDVSLYPYNSIGGGGFSVWNDNEDILEGMGAAPADGSFNHFAYRQTDATTHDGFVSGANEGSDASSKTTNTTVDEFALGYYVGNGERFGGIIDDVRVYLRALSDDEILFLASM